MPNPDPLRQEFDAPWKVALELFLEPFLHLCFPAVHALIDWQFAPVFLDTELQQIAPTHHLGARAVDKLVKVRCRNGSEEWLLVHVEVQAQPDPNFPVRMWTYFYRLWDKFSQRTISLAVLADDQPAWRPSAYHTELAGCVQHFEFPIFKVIELEDAAGVFERFGNPFALLVAAHQAALKTRSNAAERCAARFRLVRYLYRGGLERDQVLHLFRLIEWLTQLPSDWQLRFEAELAKFEGKEQVMTSESLLSVIEVRAIEKGREEGREKGREEGREKGREEGLEQGRRQGILDALEARFGTLSPEVRAKVQTLVGEAPLRQALRRAITASSLQDFLDSV
jgi:hypothetical protein